MVICCPIPPSRDPKRWSRGGFGVTRLLMLLCRGVSLSCCAPGLPALCSCGGSGRRRVLLSPLFFCHIPSPAAGSGFQGSQRVPAASPCCPRRLLEALTATLALSLVLCREFGGGRGLRAPLPTPVPVSLTGLGIPLSQSPGGRHSGGSPRGPQVKRTPRWELPIRAGMASSGSCGGSCARPEVTQPPGGSLKPPPSKGRPEIPSAPAAVPQRAGIHSCAHRERWMPALRPGLEADREQVLLDFRRDEPLEQEPGGLRE